MMHSEVLCASFLKIGSKYCAAASCTKLVGFGLDPALCPLLSLSLFFEVPNKGPPHLTTSTTYTCPGTNVSTMR
jgi:hypothetical protein